MTDTAPLVPAGEPAAPMSRREILLVFVSLMLGMFLASLDQTIVATALPTIVGELGGLAHLSWVVTAYLLTSTASAPLYGKLSDLYGRKLMFQRKARSSAAPPRMSCRLYKSSSRMPSGMERLRFRYL